MESYRKLLKLAGRFESKLSKISQDQQQDTGIKTEQMGTTELFFGNDENQKKFGQLIMTQNVKDEKGQPIKDKKGNEQNRPVYKALEDYYYKNNGVACSFDLKIKAEPGKGASWILTVEPEQLKPAIKAALDKELLAFPAVKMTMDQKAKIADALAKKGAGTGPEEFKVGNIELNP